MSRYSYVTMKVTNDSYQKLMIIKRYLSSKHAKKYNNSEIIEYFFELLKQIDPLFAEYVRIISTK